MSVTFVTCPSSHCDLSVRTLSRAFPRYDTICVCQRCKFIVIDASLHYQRSDTECLNYPVWSVVFECLKAVETIEIGVRSMQWRRKM